MTTQPYPAGSARGLGAADTPYIPPFSVQGSCVLSEDYFLTGQVIISDGDLIRPFLRADGTVEALVLSGGNLSWLHRDPGTTSGWSYVPLSADPNVVVPGEVSDVAVGTDSSGSVMGVCVAPNTGDPSYPYLLCPLVFDPLSGTWYSDPDAASPLGDGLSRFRAGTDPITGTPYFYASDGSGQFTITGPSQDIPVEVSGPALSGVTDGWLLWASSGWTSDAAWAAGIVVTSAAGTFTWYQQNGSYAVDTQGEQLQGQGRLLWVGWPPSGVAGLDWSSPGYAYQDSSGHILWARPGADTVGPNDIGSTPAALRQNVGELIAEAGQNAKTIEGWLDQLPAIVNVKLTEIGQLADGFFKNLENEANQAIDELSSGLGDRTFGSPVPSPPSAAFDMTKFLSGAQHNWLLDKIESFFVSDTPVEQNADLQAAFDELATAVQDGLQFVADLGQTFYTALQTMFATSESYRQAELADFLTQLKVTVDALLAFADAVVQALIDLAKAAMDQLGSMLSHGYEDIPLVSALLSHFGVDTTMNVAHVVSMVLMYPATLANRIINGSGSTLFPALSTGQGELGVAAELNWAFGLGLSAAIGQGIWGVADSVGDLQRVQGQEPSGIIGWIDIASPLVLAILEWPGTPAGPPFASPIDGSGPDGAMIWPNWLLGLVPPIVGLCGQFADYTPPEAVQATGDAPQEWPEIGQWFTMTAAIASTVLGSIYNFNPQTGQSAETQAAGILSNVSNIIAPFATKELAETTSGGSEIIKMFIDYLGNLGAAGCMGAALEA